MDPLTIAMLLGTVAKTTGDVQGAKTKRAEAAVQNTYSPWTGMKGDTGPAPDVYGNLFQGATAALGQQQASANQENNQQLMDLYKKRLELENQGLAGKAGASNGLEMSPAVPSVDQNFQQPMYGQRQPMRKSPWLGA